MTACGTQTRTHLGPQFFVDAFREGKPVAVLAVVEAAVGGQHVVHLVDELVRVLFHLKRDKGV